jgi:hypothetical protein
MIGAYITSKEVVYIPLSYSVSDMLQNGLPYLVNWNMRRVLVDMGCGGSCHLCSGSLAQVPTAGPGLPVENLTLH